MRPLLQLLLFFALVIAWPGKVGAQGEAPVPEKNPGLSQEITEAQAALEASSLEEAFKVAARETLDKAAAILDQARDFKARTKELRETNTVASAEIGRLEKELAELTAKEAVEPSIPGEVEDLRNRVEERRAELASLDTQLAEKRQQLADLKARPVEISARLPKATAELSVTEAKARVAVETEGESLVVTADRLKLLAEAARIEAEVAMLRQEQIGQPQREQIATLEEQVLAARTNRARAGLAELEKALAEQMRTEVEKFRIRVSALLERVSDPELKQLAGELAPLLDQLEEASSAIKETKEWSDRVGQRIEEIRRESERLRRQAELGGLDGAYAHVLLEQRRRLPDQRTLSFNLDDLAERMSQAQLESMRLDELAEKQEALIEKWKDRPVAGAVLEQRAELIDRVFRSQRRLIQDLSRLSSDLAALRDLSGEFSRFLSEQLFWRRSSPPLAGPFFRDLPEAAASTFAPGRLRELGELTVTVIGNRPFTASLVALLVVLLLGFRHRLRASIQQSGKRIRRISTDRLVHTLRALLDSLLVAAPLPLLLGFLGFGLLQEPGIAAWVRGLAVWLVWASGSLMWILSLRELARKQGVGRVHFGWDDGACDILRRALFLIMLTYLPGVLVASLAFFEENMLVFDTMGRLGFMVGQVGLAWAFFLLFRPDVGVFRRIIENRPDRLLSKTRYLWLSLAVGLPLALAVISAMGYTLTALVLSRELETCLRWVAAGFVFYALLLRWFMIRERRIALREAIEERKARRENQDKADDKGEETTSADEEHNELELEAVAQQTRRLLRSLIGIGVFITICYSLAGSLPIDRATAEVDVSDGISALGVLRGLVVALITFTVVKNLPGILDLAGMRESGIAPGTRYAIATLAQYALAAIGFVLITNQLSVDWARFGWIAAALGVGLGFGLQEIVANFVCGIIILFERPIRVGDVVTVGEVTGRVSDVRMRATTITNWERQEFVVPNKEFITGSLINWTLTSALNRVSIPVGVAYGSDTVLARRILGEIVETHALILEDPAPMVTFDAFGDSTLNLTLRFFLPDLDNRLTVITEVNEAIDRRFKDAGIEIAFPQRDLHLRTVPEALVRGRRDEGDAGRDSQDA